MMANEFKLAQYEINPCHYHCHKKEEPCYRNKVVSKWGYKLPEKEENEV